VNGLWATKSEGVGLIVRALSFQDFQPMWSWYTNVSHRQTDGRTDDMQSQCRALHYSASRGKSWRRCSANERTVMDCRSCMAMHTERHEGIWYGMSRARSSSDEQPAWVQMKIKRRDV